MAQKHVLPIGGTIAQVARTTQNALDDIGAQLATVTTLANALLNAAPYANDAAAATGGVAIGGIYWSTGSTRFMRRVT